MSRDSVWAILAGILLTLLALLVFEELFFPKDLGITMIPSGAFAVFLWLNAYRIGKKKRSVTD
jgi:hypothetical protein